MPNPPQKWNAMSTDSPKFFGFPVRVSNPGVVELKYRFVCDEGVSIEGTLKLNFPDQTL